MSDSEKYYYGNNKIVLDELNQARRIAGLKPLTMKEAMERKVLTVKSAFRKKQKNPKNKKT